jgi:hypothetical protein
VSVDGEAVSGSLLSGLSAGVYALQVTDAQGCEFEESVLVFDPSGVREVDAFPARIHPNPVSALLFVEWEPVVAAWQISDATGRTVLHGVDGLPTGMVDVSGLRAGAYLLVLRDLEGRVARMRFVKE